MSKKQAKERVVTDRRSFMKLGASSVVGGALALATEHAASAAETTEQSASTDGQYRETAHVKKYYDLARF